MEKYIAYVETRVGNQTYTLTIESDEAMSASDYGYYFVSKARVVKIVIHGSNSGTNRSPFQDNEFYDILRFPIACTMMSQKKFEY